MTEKLDVLRYMAAMMKLAGSQHKEGSISGMTHQLARKGHVSGMRTPL